MNAVDVENVRKWGGSTTDAILDPLSKIFTIPGVDGLVGYREAHGCAVVYGDPVCSDSQTKNLVQAFHAFCSNTQLKIIYLVISEEFGKWLIQHHFCNTLIEYGEELFLNPHDDPRKKEGVHASLVRRKARHAIKEDVKAFEYTISDTQIEKGILEVGQKWLENRKGPQIHFSHVRSFDYRQGKRWFYAEKEGKVIGVVILSRLDKYPGWLLNHLMFNPEAPGGVPELLVVTALDTLAKEGCNFVTFGTSPGKELGEIIGLGGFSKYVVKNVYNIANKIYHLDGKKGFWEKFDPQTKKTFLAFQDSVGITEMLALKNALNATF